MRAHEKHRAGNLEDAAALYAEVLRGDPYNFDALFLMGVLQIQRGALAEADGYLDKALAMRPYAPEALQQRAALLNRLGRAAEALTCYDKAVALKPESAELWNNRGNVLLSLRRPEEALVSFERAAALVPGNARVKNNRANALCELRRFAEAIKEYGRAISLAPDDAALLNHRAIAHFEAKNYSLAAQDFERALALAPDTPYAPGNLLYSRLNGVDWEGLDALRDDVLSRLKRGGDVITPIHCAAVSASPEEMRACARIWAIRKYPAAETPLWRGESYRHSRIRVAYLSADFHSHATAALMAGVFERHDKRRFEVHAISYGRDDSSPMRRRLVSAFEHFHDMRAASDADTARLLRNLEIDIAVDLKGYTEEARPGILAHRVAPVQAHYLGFPGSLGAGYIDYLIADAVTIPGEHRSYYSEKIVTLPGSYQCNDEQREIADKTPSRGECWLPDKGFVFCCFNNSYKIMPETFAIWMRLLRKIEGSVLWLLDDNEAATRNSRQQAQASGVFPSRLVFAPRISLPEHLARHRVADLFLDTLPYGAHTTASDALWAGLPVLTRMGTAFAGRVAASLNNAVGLPEMIVNSTQEYEDLALRLATLPETLAAVKAKLAANRRQAQLFDTSRFTRNLEAAYTLIWRRAMAGEPPTDIKIAEPQ
jgi:predicted O-linked N-acetylglucosamine transferase (SPINDLY family)